MRTQPGQPLDFILVIFWAENVAMPTLDFWSTELWANERVLWKVFLGSAKEEMPISHKIRQYRPLLRCWGLRTRARFSGLWSGPRKLRPSREYGGVLCTKIWLALFVGARDLSPWTKRQSIIGGSLVWHQPSLPGYSSAAILSYPTHPDMLL